MAANQPLIHGNEIHSNRDSCISLVNRICNKLNITFPGRVIAGVIVKNIIPRNMIIKLTQDDFQHFLSDYMFWVSKRNISVRCFFKAPRTYTLIGNYQNSPQSCSILSLYSGNARCGVWIMAANQPLIHGNEIHSNRDSGISLVIRKCYKINITFPGRVIVGVIVENIIPRNKIINLTLDDFQFFLSDYMFWVSKRNISVRCFF